jgi:hypothetical protein
MVIYCLLMKKNFSWQHTVFHYFIITSHANFLCILCILETVKFDEQFSTNFFRDQTPRPSKSSLLVQTKSGPIRGVFVNDQVKAWLGIPYAEPPLGFDSNISYLLST